MLKFWLVFCCPECRQLQLTPGPCLQTVHDDLVKVERIRVGEVPG